MTRVAPLVPFLALLFTGTVCSAMIVPYMGFFLVEGLGREPWTISLYSGLAICLTVYVNRSFGRRIDRGDRVFPLVGFALAGYGCATLALSLVPTFWTALTIGVLGFGLGSSAVSTMFSLGGGLAERHGVPRSSMNAWMRATTSTGWMLGPAITFLVADLSGPNTVFRLGCGVALVWLLLWWRILPREATVAAPPRQALDTAGVSRRLWWAAGFIFCLSTAHSLTFSTLPLFYVREVGLPGYAPGLGFSIKTFVEVLVILATPALIARVGLYRSLMGTTLLAVGTIWYLSTVSSFPQMAVGMALEGAYYGLYASMGLSYLQQQAPERPAQATALYWNIVMGSGLLAGPAAGMIAQLATFQTVVVTAAGIAAVAALVLILGRPKQPLPPPTKDTASSGGRRS